MMTSAKIGTPCRCCCPDALALLPSLGLISRRPLKTLVVCVIALFASALPTLVLNAKFSGDWSGAGIGRSTVKYAAVLRTGANVVSIASQNLVPPVFPVANKWNAEIKQHIPENLESSLRVVMMEPQAYEFSVPEMQTEEGAGLGFGVSALLLASIVAAGFARRKQLRLRLFHLAAMRAVVAGSGPPGPDDPV